MKTRIGYFDHFGKNAYSYEPASIRYRKFLWWKIPVERVIEHPVITRAKQMGENKMLEKHIERKVCDYAKQCGFLVYKFTSPQRRSVPDRLLISPHGVVLFIEFKQTGKTPTEGQEREIQRLKDKNVPVFVVDDIDEGKRIVGLYAAGIDPWGYCESTVGV